MTEREEAWISQQPAENRDKLIKAIDGMRDVLATIETDIYREGLVDTPLRYIKFLTEFTSVEEPNIRQFENDGSTEMVVVRGIPFFSLCEHHLAPFYGTVDVAYFPIQRVVGLSKIPRAVKWISQWVKAEFILRQKVNITLPNSLLEKFMRIFNINPENSYSTKTLEAWIEEQENKAV